MNALVAAPTTPRAVRAFQVVYGLLVLNFVFPALSYAMTPGRALANVDLANRLLGGAPYPPDTGEVWHMLAVGNVMTLAFLCALLLCDLRRFYPALPALVFLKSYSSIYSLVLGATRSIPFFLGVFAFDGLTVVAMIVFAVRAYEALEGVSWLESVLLPNRAAIVSSLARVRAAGLVTTVPTPFQIAVGVLRMWHRVLFRADTIGTCSDPVRHGLRARLLRNRAVRLPFLLRERVIAPFDGSGLASSPERVIRHLLGAHHDELQFVYDLQLLSITPHALEACRAAALDIVRNDTERTRWLRDLCVFEGYHERLLEACDRALAGELSCDRALAGKLAMPDDVERDVDISLTAYLRWCAAAPTDWRALREALRKETLRLGAAHA